MKQKLKFYVERHEMSGEMKQLAREWFEKEENAYRQEFIIFSQEEQPDMKLPPMQYIVHINEVL